MSILMDGIGNIYSINDQINNLRSLNAQNPDDPGVFRYLLEQNFNQMINDLTSPVDDEDDSEDSDYFSFFSSANESTLQSLQMQGVIENADVEALLGDSSIINSLPDTTSTEYLNSLYNLGQL